EEIDDEWDADECRTAPEDVAVRLQRPHLGLRLVGYPFLEDERSFDPAQQSTRDDHTGQRKQERTDRAPPHQQAVADSTEEYEQREYPKDNHGGTRTIPALRDDAFSEL